MVDKDSFEEWLANPVTERFLDVLNSYGILCQMEWQKSAWESEFLTVERQVFEAKKKGRAELALEIAGLDWQTFEEFNEGL